MRISNSKMGFVIKLSTSILLLFSAEATANPTPYGNPPRYSSYAEINDLAVRFHWIQVNLTTNVLEIHQRVQVERAAFDQPGAREVRRSVLSGLFMAYHQQPHLMSMLYDLWSRKSHQNIEITIFDWDGNKEKVRGRLVDLKENGDYMDPYITLRLQGGIDRRISMRIMSLTDLIKDHGFREIFDPSWRDGQLKTCRSILW